MAIQEGVTVSGKAKQVLVDDDGATVTSSDPGRPQYVDAPPGRRVSVQDQGWGKVDINAASCANVLALGAAQNYKLPEPNGWYVLQVAGGQANICTNGTASATSAGMCLPEGTITPKMQFDGPVLSVFGNAGYIWIVHVVG
jgi:hypothetical protein